MQVNTACSAKLPPSGPTFVHVDAVPLIAIAHAIEPAGGFAPVIPVTVAVKVIVPPKTGLAGADVTVIVGLAFETIRETAEVGASTEKLISPR